MEAQAAAAVLGDGDSKGASAIRTHLGTPTIFPSQIKELPQNIRTRGYAALDYFVKTFPASDIAKLKADKQVPKHELLARYITDAGTGALSATNRTIIEKTEHMHDDSAWYHVSHIATVVGDKELAQDIADECDDRPSQYKQSRERGLKEYWRSQKNGERRRASKSRPS